MSAAGSPSEQAQSPSPSVTSVRDRNRERKRLQRERQRERPIVYQQDDWELFLNPATLPQKAGCQPRELRALVLKELVDNALDAGANVTLTRDGRRWVIRDDGPGIDPEQIPDLFAVNRPLRSSKLKRLPTRGMLGNGLRVVMALARTITVETRGTRLTLQVDETTGHTTITRHEQIPETRGLTVILPAVGENDGHLARRTLALAECGFVYRGLSMPHWYGPQDLARLFHAAPADTTAAEVVRDLGLKPPDRLGAVLAHEIDNVAVVAVLREMQRQIEPIKPDKIGKLGSLAFAGYDGYGIKAGIAIETAGAHVPYVVEASASCELSEKKGIGRVRYILTLNRSATLASLYGESQTNYLSIEGCGLDRAVKAPTGNYTIYLSIITPHVQLSSDGKAPSLVAYADAIVDVILKAAREAHRNATRPDSTMKIKEAAWLVMPAAYAAASSGGTLPANARQVMYAARGPILRLTGKRELNDQYFTQTLLPDYIEAHPEITADWDVVFDDRGTFIEPHTGRVVPLGTIEVREYLGERPAPRAPASVSLGLMYQTTGPHNRYRDILFIEKEGFSALISHARLAERFDLGVMSTKGLSTTAARMLIDKLMQSGVERVFVLHDFDVYGFSIFGTLGKSNRRYRFENPVHIVDLGLRLSDVESMGLEWETYSPSGDWDKRSATLATHDASREEIRRLRSERVELNAMTSSQFVQLLERKLTEHGVRKVVPGDDVLQHHVRQVITRTLLNRRLDEIRSAVDAAVARIMMPSNLGQQIEAALQRQPDLPWDLAAADIARRIADSDGETS
jgi:hypothetical protein